MSKKGGDRTQKSLSVSKVRKFPRKEHVWTIRSIAGPYKKDESVPLGFVLRDMLGIAQTMKEVKVILRKGKVKVNGTVRKDYRYSVGLFDIISIEGLDNAYKLILDKKGRMIAEEVEKKTAVEKICKVVGKCITKGGTLVIRTNDGMNFYLDQKEKDKYNVGDSIVVKLPEKRITKHMELKKGAKVTVLSGTHAGSDAKVIEVKEGTIRRPKMVMLKSGEKRFVIPAQNVIVTG
jgi:small subunit ribosomal protein S4e